MKRIYLLLPLLLFLYAGTVVWADAPLRDPFIPDGEWLVYSVQEDKNRSVLRAGVTIDGESREFYSIVTTTDREVTELELYRGNMMPFSVRTIRDMGGYRIDSSTLLEGTPDLREGEIRILDTTGLLYALRGYPFHQPEDLRITFFSSGEDDGSFEISVGLGGRETLTTAGKPVDCYRLEMSFKMSGVFAVFSKMVPKTKLWYSVDAPHYLVKYQGQNGPPGTPLTTMELTDYSGWQ